MIAIDLIGSPRTGHGCELRAWTFHRAQSRRCRRACCGARAQGPRQRRSRGQPDPAGGRRGNRRLWRRKQARSGGQHVCRSRYRVRRTGHHGQQCRHGWPARTLCGTAIRIIGVRSLRSICRGLISAPSRHSSACCRNGAASSFKSPRCTNSFRGQDTAPIRAPRPRFPCSPRPSRRKWQRRVCASWRLRPAPSKPRSTPTSGSNPDSLRDLDKKIAMSRPGEPEEIGRVAAFLASDLASYITGTTIAVDGGMLIYPDFGHGG